MVAGVVHCNAADIAANERRFYVVVHINWHKYTRVSFPTYLYIVKVCIKRIKFVLWCGFGFQGKKNKVFLYFSVIRSETIIGKVHFCWQFYVQAQALRSNFNKKICMNPKYS